MQACIVPIIILSGFAGNICGMKDLELPRRESKVLLKDLAVLCSKEESDSVENYIRQFPGLRNAAYGILMRNIRSIKIARVLEQGGFDLDKRDDKGSILHHACLKEPSFLEYIVERYCGEGKKLGINDRRKKDGQAPIHRWAHGTHHNFYLPDCREQLRILVGAGADCTLRDNTNRTVLEILEQYKSEDRYSIVRSDFYDVLICDVRKAIESKK